MALYSAKEKERHIQLVQRILATKWNITIDEIKRQLDRNGVVLEEDYIGRLRREAREQNITMVKEATRESVAADFMRVMLELQTVTWGIVMDSAVTPSIRIAAINTAESLASNQLKMLFDTGILKKQLGEMDVRHLQGADPTVLPPGLAEGFIKMMKGWGMLDEQKKKMLEDNMPKRPKDPWWWNNLNKTTSWDDEW